jgi:hypothetical protein
VVFENLNAISGFGTFTFNDLQATGSTTTVGNSKAAMYWASTIWTTL